MRVEAVLLNLADEDLDALAAELGVDNQIDPTESGAAEALCTVGLPVDALSGPGVEAGVLVDVIQMFLSRHLAV